MHLSDSAMNMTSGPIRSQIVKFAVPVFLGNLFQQLYNIVDSLVVGNFSGKDELAAVTSSGSLIFLLVGFLNGIFMGAGVVASRAFGAGDDDRLRKTVHTCVAFGLCAAVGLSIVGVVLTPQILRWMHTPPEVLPQSTLYLGIYFAGVSAMVMYNVANGIFQSVGDSRHPLIYLIVSSITNALFDLLFVAVFGWGVAGAAAATVIAQFLSAVLAFTRLMRVKEVYGLRIKEIRFYPGKLHDILGMGLPSGFQNSIIAFANVIVQSNINVFEEDAVAGCGTYAKIEGFVFLPISCFAMALTTFVSQNLGAGRLDRVRKGTRFGILSSVVLSEVIGVLIFFFIPYLAALFNRDPAVIDYSTMQGRTESLFYFLLAYSHCIMGILRGAGKTKIPMFVMLACWCIIRIIYITIAVKLAGVIQVIFWAYPLTWGLSSITFTVYYFKANWLNAGRTGEMIKQ